MGNVIKKLAGFKLRYEFVMLVILAVTMIKRIALSSGDYYFSFLLFDYSHGYMTRGFIGEVISWFTDNVTESLAFGLVITVSSLLVLAAVFLLGKAIRDSEGEARTASILVSAVLILSPMTFRWFFNNGLQSDLYFYTCTVVALLFVKNKYLRWLVPLFGVLATLISVTYIVHCMTLLAIILLYEFAKKTDVKSGMLCLLTYVGIIAIAVYAAASRDNLTFKDAGELYSYMASKTQCELSSETVRYYIDEYFLSFPEATKKYIGLEISRNIYTIIFGIAFVYLPFAVIFTAFWNKCFRICKNPLKKSVYFFSVAAMLLVCAPGIYTGEPGRWLGAGFVIQFGLFLYMLHDKDDAVCEVFASWCDAVRKRSFLFYVPAAYYTMLVML